MVTTLKKIIFLYCILSISLIIHSEEIECPDDPSPGQQLFPHPNCSLFYVCEEMNLTVMDCPPNLYFNPTLKVCDYPINVPECSGGTRPPITTTTTPTTTTTTPTTTTTTPTTTTTTPTTTTTTPTTTTTTPTTTTTTRTTTTTTPTTTTTTPTTTTTTPTTTTTTPTTTTTTPTTTTTTPTTTTTRTTTTTTPTTTTTTPTTTTTRTTTTTMRTTTTPVPGSWITIQRRGSNLDVGELRQDFYLNWINYTQGFGNPNKDFWRGLDYIADLTKNGDCELTIEMRNFSDITEIVNYKVFKVSSASDNYRLTVNGFSGSKVDALSYHNGRIFSTKDRDNDNWNGNCAVQFNGGWWYDSCYDSNLNGIFYQEANEFHNAIKWASGFTRRNLKFVEMKVRQKI